MLIKYARATAAATCRQLAFTPGTALAAVARRGLAALDPGSMIEDLREKGATPLEIAGLAPHFNVSRLSDSHLAVLGHMLLRCVPFASDPPLRLGAHTPEPGYEVRRQRDRVLATLADHGQAEFFEELAARCNPASHETITWYLREARSRAADSGYPGLPPQQTLHLLGRADARLVRHDHDLLEVVIAQLAEPQREITQLRQYQFLWDNPGPPRHSQERGHYLRLGPPKAPGPAPGCLLRTRGAHVIAEAKHITHKHLMTAMEGQLARQYMLPKGARQSIYLGYWTDPGQRTKGRRDRGRLVKALTEQAAQAAERGLEIRPFLLDISYQ